jgi:ATP-dependent Clp protease protease subunit
MKFWNFKGSGDKRAELLLYGDISERTWFGDEVTPKQFKADLDALGDIAELDIYINSGGGDVFAGFAIYNMLKRHAAKKTVYVDGLAASIASVIAMAGDKIIMPENAMLMIHNAWANVRGNKAKLRKIADEMEKMDGLLADTYMSRSGKGKDDIVALMDAETWFTAAEAVEAGLADEIEASKKLAASVNGDFLNLNGQKFDLSRYKDATKPKNIAPESAEPPQGGFFTPEGTYTPEYKAELAHRWDEGKHSTPDNGGESQPVADNTALQAQRRRFNTIRTKILRGV